MNVKEKEVKSDLQQKLPGNPVLSVQADVSELGNPEQSVLVVMSDRVEVIAEDGNVLKSLPIEGISEVRIVSRIGGGLLVADTAQGTIVLVRYTAALNRKIGFAAKTVNALIRKEELPVQSVKDVPKVCENCRSRIPEGSDLCPSCTDKGKVIARLLRYAIPYKFHMIAAALMLMVATLMEIIPPYLTKVMVDDVLQTKNAYQTLLWLVIGLAATRIMLSVMQTLRGYIGVWVGGHVMGDIRRETYQSLMKLSLSYFDRRQTSQFIGRVNSDSEAMREFLTEGIIWISGQVLMILAIGGMLISMNWKLALMALLPAPLIILASMTIWPMIRHFWYRHWRSLNRINVLVGDALQGIRVVKAFGQEDSEKQRYSEANQNLIRETIRSEGIWQGVFPAFALISTAGSLLVWYYGGSQVIRDELTLGTLMAFTVYLGMFFGPLQWFSQGISWTSRALSAADRVFEIMDTKAEVPTAADAIRIPQVQGRVVLDQITYGYEKYHPVLKDVRLEVEPGEMIGLVGHSGAGKSTLINMICRFYDPDHGVITLDGIDLKKIDQEDLRKQIGVVLQETFLFDGTIAENIAYSKPNATPLEIMRAAKIANAHDFIIRMPDGYDTRVGERGHRLSGGEKQRIAIARAIIHDPRILILDEATASVDTETEKQIQTAISRLIKGRTTFAIAHRLSTLRNANRLVVLDKGRVAEIGTHEELLDRKGIYYRLVEAQREMSQLKGVEG